MRAVDGGALTQQHHQRPVARLSDRRSTRNAAQGRRLESPRHPIIGLEKVHRHQLVAPGGHQPGAGCETRNLRLGELNIRRAHRGGRGGPRRAPVSRGDCHDCPLRVRHHRAVRRNQPPPAVDRDTRHESEPAHAEPHIGGLRPHHPVRRRDDDGLILRAPICGIREPLNEDDAHPLRAGRVPRQARRRHLGQRITVIPRDSENLAVRGATISRHGALDARRDVRDVPIWLRGTPQRTHDIPVRRDHGESVIPTLADEALRQLRLQIHRASTRRHICT